MFHVYVLNLKFVKQIRRFTTQSWIIEPIEVTFIFNLQLKYAWMFFVLIVWEMNITFFSLHRLKLPEISKPNIHNK